MLPDATVGHFIDDSGGAVDMEGEDDWTALPPEQPHLYLRCVFLQFCHVALCCALHVESTAQRLCLVL